MGNNFQAQAQKKEEHSAGSLLLGALFGGVSGELAETLNTAYDAAEVASEFHTYNHDKKNKGAFQLGKKNSLGATFAMGGMSAQNDNRPDVQKRYTMEYTYQPRRGRGMRMAA